MESVIVGLCLMTSVYIDYNGYGSNGICIVYNELLQYVSRLVASAFSLLMKTQYTEYKTISNLVLCTKSTRSRFRWKDKAVQTTLKHIRPSLVLNNSGPKLNSFYQMMTGKHTVPLCPRYGPSHYGNRPPHTATQGNEPLGPAGARHELKQCH